MDYRAERNEHYMEQVEFMFEEITKTITRQISYEIAKRMDIDMGDVISTGIKDAYVEYLNEMRESDHKQKTHRDKLRQKIAEKRKLAEQSDEWSL